MKKVFAFFLVLVVALYALARLTLERPSDDTVHLRWATDPNPAKNPHPQDGCRKIGQDKALN